MEDRGILAVPENEEREGILARVEDSVGVLAVTGMEDRGILAVAGKEEREGVPARVEDSV